MRSFGQGHLVKVIWSFSIFETMVTIENTQECFVMLWRKLERTRRLLGGQYKRFCIRNVMKAWEPQEGWNELPLPSRYPRKHRELLRAIVSVQLGISYWKVNLKALDKAYSIAFPNSTSINVNKKRGGRTG